jgi:hypothetical protein
MKITKSLLLTIFSLVLIYLLGLPWRKPDKLYVDAGGEFVFSKGNAPENLRSEVLQQLRTFQEGYTKRDVSKVQSFAGQLFSKDNIVIIGTGGPKETMVGYGKSAGLVKSDWESWGDCRFLMDNAQISASGSTAWFSTVGTVNREGSSLTRYSVPLILSGILVKENGIWKLQQMQFQSNPNLDWFGLVYVLLFIWLVLNVLLLGFHIYRWIRNRNKTNQAITASV